jgi:hypothetical protein
MRKHSLRARPGRVATAKARRAACASRLCVLIAALLLAGPASAESQLLLPYPDVFDDIAAGTYDEEGKQVGAASISIREMSNRTVVMDIETRGAGAARNVAWAELEVMPKERGPALRLLRERSESFDEQGKSLGLMQIDHAGGKASCGPPQGSGDDVVHFDRPGKERITNVPLNLLFLPLLQGHVEQINFQLFLCRGGPRVLEFAATVKGERPPPSDDFRIVEIEYRPELGRFLSVLARGFVPNLSFWFDANGNGTYLAHRMPLFSKGPEVMIVRDGIAPSLLEAVQ